MSAADRWFLRPPDPAARARLFVFPYAGVGASMVAGWPRRLGAAEVVPLQFPARENRIGEPHFGTYERLADQAVRAVGPWLSTPYAFFGHCSGALPAFETVLRIEEQGLPAPAELFVSGQAAPCDCPFDRLLDLDDDGLREELARVIGERGGTPTPALLDVAWRVLRDDLAATGRYRRADIRVLGCPVTALHWADDAEITRPQVDRWLGYSAASRVVVLPGGHYDVLTAPDPLLQLLSGWTAALAGDTGRAV
ncbi:MAG: thioesterase II family protein [Catenulispora sp.]